MRTAQTARDTTGRGTRRWRERYVGTISWRTPVAKARGMAPSTRGTSRRARTGHAPRRCPLWPSPLVLGGRATSVWHRPAERRSLMDPSWIATAFVAVNSIRVLFYLPQIVAVARSTDGARDIALSTWAMWALTNGLGAAYGVTVAHDRLLALSFGLSLLACVLTMVLTVVQRLRWGRRALDVPVAPAA